MYDPRQCHFRTLHYQDVWKAQRDMRVLNTQRRDVIYFPRAVLSGWNMLERTLCLMASSLLSLRLLGWASSKN